ncbi:type II toxin-antitoxin system RelE/ParE family toxin [Symplocastrum sp. BBK-W-15]|uniref:Type II toxin-antitoxin system RelE/ParE family toxin n=1 Tax=Limnofasciculus baicalensis BBK-W-15 TaxID=2699891 RepID=A0AAE3GVJ9_9CYAN|nr:type II toxin-antitoxin system RelE/ParE family toxin [Limnofasciculus baicalensis]MCP2730857.1 type II toxin-antitoxin system RelE/ParE family toxin [Limnofasciculus baicalensis BBK-W-15]
MSLDDSPLSIYIKRLNHVQYQVEFKPKAIKDLQEITLNIQEQIISKIEVMQNDLHGDVKRLTNFTPEYRLRVGDYRVLFEVDKQAIIIYRIKHRSKAY